MQVAARHESALRYRVGPFRRESRHATGRVPGDLMAKLLLVLLAALALLLIPWVPELVRLRIRFLRWIHWKWAADLLDDHFAGWCWFFRVALGVVAAALFFVVWAR